MAEDVEEQWIHIADDIADSQVYQGPKPSLERTGCADPTKLSPNAMHKYFGCAKGGQPAGSANNVGADEDTSRGRDAYAYLATTLAGYGGEIQMGTEVDHAEAELTDWQLLDERTLSNLALPHVQPLVNPYCDECQVHLQGHVQAYLCYTCGQAFCWKCHNGRHAPRCRFHTDILFENTVDTLRQHKLENWTRLDSMRACNVDRSSPFDPPNAGSVGSASDQAVRVRCQCADCVNGVPPRQVAESMTDHYVMDMHAEFLQ